MFEAIRGILIALIAALLLVALTTAPANAQSWNAGSTSGMTAVESVLQDGLYTWTLWNNFLPNDSPYQLLVWELIPFDVNVPLDVDSPEGWFWTGNKWKLEAAGGKYFTPHALGPGESLTFTYKENPDGPVLKQSGLPFTGVKFLTHVAAVVPDSGSAGGSVKWVAAQTPHGSTWFDIAKPAENLQSPVPEPGGLAVLAMGISIFGARFFRKR